MERFKNEKEGWEVRVDWGGICFLLVFFFFFFFAFVLSEGAWHPAVKLGVIWLLTSLIMDPGLDLTCIASCPLERHPHPCRHMEGRLVLHSDTSFHCLREIGLKILEMFP